MALFGQPDDLHRNPLLRHFDLRNSGQQKFGADRPAQALDLDRLLPEIEHADRVLQQVHDPLHQRLEPCSVTLRRNRSVEGERSEEDTSELQSLMRNAYAVFCWNKKI